MFFSIPDVTEISAKSSHNQQAYTLFNVHVNGVHHCSLRYSQLYIFNQELRRLLPRAMGNVDVFPPKKLFSLSTKETDERRILLEHYLQAISQNKYILTTSYFNEFFLNAQRETFLTKLNNTDDKVNMKICLLNKHEIVIENVSTKGNTTHLFDLCISKLQLSQDFHSYFALFFFTQNDKNQMNILRPLYDFESPYLSFEQNKKAYEQIHIVLKRSYWDSEIDLQMIEDRRARNLLFVQAQYEIEQSEPLCPNELYQQLETLKNNNSLKDYILLARTTKFYGHIFLPNCAILYPIDDKTTQKLCQCILAIGNNEIICCIQIDEKKKKKIKDITFKVTRIRCWKITRTKQESFIAIEYLIDKDRLDWITIHTQQSPLINTCLQNIVDEIIAKRMSSATPLTQETTTNESTKSKGADGLAKRTNSQAERIENNLFEGALGDDDL